MSWTLCTSGAAIAKAGANKDIIFEQISGAPILAKWSDEAEGSLNAVTRRDWVALSGSTATNFKGVLSDAVSSDIGNRIINYNMGGYTSRLEAQTMLDVNRDNYMRCIDTLKDEKNKEKMI